MKTVVEMALEAGIEVTYDPTETPTRAFAECWIEDLERFAALVRADEQKKWEEQTDIEIREAVADEREAIYSEWHSCVMADLENGVKWLNEKAAAEWHKNYPAQSSLFPAWIETRSSR